MKGWQKIGRGVGGVIAGMMLASTVSCEVGPDYERPVMPTPTTFKGSARTRPATQPLRTLTAQWWKLFNDDELTRLEELATADNQGLQAAMARVMEARAATGVTTAGLYPQLSLDPNYTRTRQPSLNRNNTSVNGGNSNATTYNQYEIPFDLSYEVDVWGRIRRTVEAAVATQNAQAADFFVVLQTLQSDLAQDYFNLRSYDAQQAIVTDTVKSYEDQLRLVKLQFKAGLLAASDVAQAEALLASTMTQEVELRRQREIEEHAIAVLLGKPPAELEIAVRTKLVDAPAVPTGMPADLLRHRPDVAEAEQNLISANASVGAAVANFYPKLTLTGTAGLETLDTSKIFDWQSRLLSFGPSISAPLFEGGQLVSSLNQAKERYAELVANYRASLLTALQDVEDSLTNIHMYAEEDRMQAEAVKASQQYFNLLQKEYGTGLITIFQIIDADRTLLSNELSQKQVQYQRLVSTVTLIKAVGGGWDANSAAATQPSVPTTAPAMSVSTLR